MIHSMHSKIVNNNRMTLEKTVLYTLHELIFWSSGVFSLM